ncbi:Ger(x)C family spore germination protein [Gottfriedia sp. NPDC056225]|uniref:Ger(x)C family spore germination protein n=1 Tax=Gottfriedia sp. NPDC056225 TaxID=3345751 RepID=UPI0035DC0AC4
MKYFQVCLLSIFLVIGVSGCRGKVNIEDVTLSMILGIDVNDQNKVEVYMASPVFSGQTKVKTEHFNVQTLSIKESRNYFDSKASGVTAGGKIQAILIGSKVLEHKNWFSILDMFFRDPKFRLNADIIFVDGPLSSVYNLKAQDKPELPIYIPQLLQTADFRNVAFRTTARKIHQMYYEKGITPFAPELAVEDNHLVVHGTTLLTNNNLYNRTLSLKETQMLKILKDHIEGQLVVALDLKKFKSDDDDVFTDEEVSFYIKDVKRKIEKKYSNGRYSFIVNLTLPIMITESPIGLTNHSETVLKNEIEKKLQKQLNNLVHSFQKDKVDPVGFGILAHSFQYSDWKKNENHWFDTYQKSNLKVKVKIIVVDKGISM